MFIKLNALGSLLLASSLLVSNVMAASISLVAPINNQVITFNATKEQMNSTVSTLGGDPERCDLVWKNHVSVGESWYNEYVDTTDNLVANGLCCDCKDSCQISVQKSLAKNWAITAGAKLSFSVLKASFDGSWTKTWGETTTTINSWSITFPGGNCKTMHFDANYIHLWGTRRFWITNLCGQIVQDDGWQKYEAWIPKVNPDGSTSGTFKANTYRTWGC